MAIGTGPRETIVASVAIAMAACAPSAYRPFQNPADPGLPVRNEVRGMFAVSRDAGGFLLTTPEKTYDLVYRLKLSAAQKRQFEDFLNRRDPNGGKSVRPYCYCDGIVGSDKVLRLKWARLGWSDSNGFAPSLVPSN